MESYSQDMDKEGGYQENYDLTVIQNNYNLTNIRKYFWNLLAVFYRKWDHMTGETAVNYGATL